MAKTSPEESVMRYFETQPIEKAEVMLSIAKSIVKKRFSDPVDTNQKTYLDSHIANLKKKGQKIKKAHISEVGSWPEGQAEKMVAELNAGNAVWGTNGPPPSLGDITLTTIQANMDAMGISNANKYPLHGAYAPGDKISLSSPEYPFPSGVGKGEESPLHPSVDGSVYPSYGGQLQSLSLSDAELKKMAEGIAEKGKKAKKNPEPEEPPF